MCDAANTERRDAYRGGECGQVYFSESNYAPIQTCARRRHSLAVALMTSKLISIDIYQDTSDLGYTIVKRESNADALCDTIDIS